MKGIEKWRRNWEKKGIERGKNRKIMKRWREREGMEREMNLIEIVSNMDGMKGEEGEWNEKIGLVEKNIIRMLKLEMKGRSNKVKREGKK